MTKGGKVPPARLVAYFATSAPICILIRRGPSKWSQMILWHTDTDEFIPGQWTIGVVHELTMTADGKYAAIGIMSTKSRIHSWEDTQVRVICRPPYFSPLEKVVNGLCVSNLTILPGDRICASDRNHSIIAKNDCPLARVGEEAWEEVRRSGFSLLNHDYVIDASHGPASGLDQQGREIHLVDGTVVESSEGSERLLFDANPYKPYGRSAPEWALRW